MEETGVRPGRDSELGGSAGGWGRAAGQRAETTHTHTPVLSCRGLWPSMAGFRQVALWRTRRGSTSQHTFHLASSPSALSAAGVEKGAKFWLHRCPS